MLPLLCRPFLSAVVVSMSWLSACSDGDAFQKPPLSFPFDTQTAGFKIETDVRLDEYNVYTFDFLFGFKEGDSSDRARVEKLVGSYELNKAGKPVEPGVPISVRVRISALKPSVLESSFERDFTEHRLHAWSDTYFQTEIVQLKLKPGTYHLVIENLKDIPELKGTPVTVTMTTDPKSSSIPE